MSDPVTNVEIEDVLASIRRLVSDESRVEPAAPRPVERLVLTPALRVSDTAPAPQPDKAPPSTQGRDEAPMRLGAEYALPEDDLDVADTTEPQAAKAPASPVPPARSQTNLEMRIAEMEALVARQTDHWEPDGDVEDSYEEAGASLEWVDHTPHEVLENAEVEDEDEDAAPYDRVMGAEETALSEAEDTLETEDEAALAETFDEDVEEVEEAQLAEDAVEDDEDEGVQPYDDTVEDDMEYGASAQSYQSAPLEDVAYDRAEEEAGEEAYDDVGFDLRDSGLDEDALRELVAEIVRQELQGTLGERITRNVRKLVRREIHRALTAQNLQ